MTHKLIRFADVMQRTGFSRSWLNKLIARGDFPAVVKTGKRAAAFVESEVDAWIERQISGRDVTRSESNT